MRGWRIVLGLLLLGTLTVIGGLPAAGNPIPTPTLLMPEEYIDALVFVDSGGLFALVEGVYPFANVGISSVKMYYPVPPDATGIRVLIDGEELPWSYVTCRCEFPPIYPTAVGDYRVIKWEIPSVPDRFTIKVHYRHEVPQVDGRYAFLYAMGTGRFLDYYAKETVAQVKVRLELGFADLEVLTDHNPVDYGLDQEAGEGVITLAVQSEPFRPLTEDLLIRFNRILSVPEAIDADGDGRISDREMLQAIRYWLDDAEVPGTGGQRVSDLTLHKLAEFWIAGGRFVLTPYQARDRAIAYLLERYPDLGLPQGALWDPERATPEGLLGAVAIRYAYGDWLIEVAYPVIPFPDYGVVVSNSATGFRWQGTVHATGVVEEG